jgi:hypothetical protein
MNAKESIREIRETLDEELIPSINKGNRGSTIFWLGQLSKQVGDFTAAYLESISYSSFGIKDN